MPITLDLSGEIGEKGVVRIIAPHLSDNELNRSRQGNAHLRIERDTNGDLLILLPKPPVVSVTEETL